jgi:hypothetical protein
MPILVRRKGEKWQRANDLEFTEEAHLQKMLYEGPELISVHDKAPAVFIREAGLPGSGQTDLLGVDTEGNILIVETKLAKNSEIRRKVIGQILEYAAYLWRLSYDEFDELFVRREGKSIIELLSTKTPEEIPNRFRETVRANLSSGTFQLFIAVDKMNDELETIIDYVSTRGPELKLQAIELRTYQLDDLEILAPQRHGEFLQLSASATPRIITIDRALANCPDDHSRKLFGLLVDSWEAVGHKVKPGQVGVAFQADVAGTTRSIFWAYRGDLQGAFGHLSKTGAPSKAVQEFRSAASRLNGFDSHKFLHELSPIVKFEKLTESEIRRFVAEADKLVQAWREASQLDMQSGSNSQLPDE